MKARGAFDFWLKEDFRNPNVSAEQERERVKQGRFSLTPPFSLPLSPFLPSCPKWWWNQFGVPQYIGGCYFLLYPRGISEFEFNSTVKTLLRGRGDFTGQNFVWSQEIEVNLGIVLENNTVVADAFRQLWDYISIASGQDDGVQVEFPARAPII